MKKTISFLAVLAIGLWSCSSGNKQEEQDVPTTLEQHDSDVKTSSSWSSTSGSGQSGTSTSSSSSGGGKPTSFSFSTSSSSDDNTDFSSIRDLAEDKELRDYLQAEMVKMLIEDNFISSEEEKLNVTITNEWMMVNKKILEDDEAKRYVDLLRSKMTLGSVFNYSFNQY